MSSEKKIVLIGIGNCGNQVAYLGEKKYPELFDCIYINTSDDDLKTVYSEISLQIKIGVNNEEDDVEGTGKNRDKMKEYLQEEVEDILRDEKFQDLIVDKRYGFVICSTAGGTGSGAGPIMATLLAQMFPDTIFKLVPVLPGKNASLMELGNALEFLDEMYNKLDKSIGNMIYDNETRSDLPDSMALQAVNENIIEDIRVFSRVDNYPTPYDSIDDADMDTIAGTPGRTVVVKLDSSALNQKILEDNELDKMIIQAIKKSAHAETDRNKQTIRWGIITYLTEECNKLYDSSFTKLAEFVGTPIERFTHNATHNFGDEQNFMYVIIAGLSPINDKISKMQKRVEELKKALASAEGNSCILNSENASYAELTNLRKQNRRNASPAKVSIGDVFGKFSN